MWTTERPEEPDEPEGPARYLGRDAVDGAWGRTANPNTVEGELQNMAAFGNGLARLSGPRRVAAKAVVWLLLLGVVLTVVYGALGIVRIW